MSKPKNGKVAYTEALQKALWVRSQLALYCDRIEIAGSIRRKRAEVGDIELVCIPKVTWSKNLFGERVDPRNQLRMHLNTLKIQNDWYFGKDGPKYKHIIIPDVGMDLDLFIVTPPAQWGVIYCIRTGPVSFSKKMVSPYLPEGAIVSGGAVWIKDKDKIVPMPEEQDFFDFCGLDYIEPELRE